MSTESWELQSVEPPRSYHLRAARRRPEVKEQTRYAEQWGQATLPRSCGISRCVTAWKKDETDGTERGLLAIRHGDAATSTGRNCEHRHERQVTTQSTDRVVEASEARIGEALC